MTMRILLVDGVMERAGIVGARLALLPGTEIVRPTPGEDLMQAVARTNPDLILVDMARPDRDALDGIRRVNSELPRPIAMFVDDGDPDFMRAAIDAGVSSYTVVQAEPPEIKPIVEAAVALFRRYHLLEEELHRTQTSLRERVLVDRAKALLIRRRRMTEPEAHLWLRRQAMEKSRRVTDIAADIVAGMDDEDRRNGQS